MTAAAFIFSEHQSAHREATIAGVAFAAARAATEFAAFAELLFIGCWIWLKTPPRNHHVVYTGKAAPVGVLAVVVSRLVLVQPGSRGPPTLLRQVWQRERHRAVDGLSEKCHRRSAQPLAAPALHARVVHQVAGAVPAPVIAHADARGVKAPHVSRRVGQERVQFGGGGGLELELVNRVTTTTFVAAIVAAAAVAVGAAAISEFENSVRFEERGGASIGDGGPPLRGARCSEELERVAVGGPKGRPLLVLSGSRKERVDGRSS